MGQLLITKVREVENMLRNKTSLICTFLLVFMFAHPVNAATSSDQSYGAQMVGAGMQIFANSIGDSMISMGTGNSTVDRAETPSLIFKMITYTVDPYTFPLVIG